MGICQLTNLLSYKLRLRLLTFLNHVPTLNREEYEHKIAEPDLQSQKSNPIIGFCEIRMVRGCVACMVLSV
jgi:hypothetical protein